MPRVTWGRPVVRAARLAVLLWGTWVIVLALGVVAWTYATFVVLFTAPLLALITSGFAVSSVLYVVRLLPRPRADPTELLPRGAEAEALSSWIATYADGWRPEIHLVALPELWVEGDILKLGMPLVRTLHDTELLVLLRDARAQHESDRTSRSVTFALRLTTGRLGRSAGGPSRGSSVRIDRIVFGTVHRRLGRLVDLRHQEVQRRRASYGTLWESASARAEVAAEGWQLLVDRWLGPASHQQVWYADPFTTLSVFLDACALSGVIDETDRLPGADLPCALPEAEHEVAHRMVEHLIGADVPPGRWEEHPTAVSLEGSRHVLAHGLQAASAVAGRPVSAAPGDIVRVAVHAEVALTVALGGRVGESSDDTSIDELLACVTAIALVDAGVVTLTWEWPRGTTMRDSHGELVALDERVADRRGLLDWLVEQGVDPDAPLWLSEGFAPGPERVLRAFNARIDRSRRERRVVVTDRALHVFPHKVSWLRGMRAALRSEDDPAAWDAAWAAIEAEAVPEDVRSTPWPDVIDARLVPDLRDSDRWRVRLRTVDGTTQVRGVGVEQMSVLLDGMLGTRFREVGPPRLSGLRWKFLRLAAVCVGSVLALLDAMFLFSPVPPFPRATALALALVGLLVATSPVTLRLWRVRRSEREHAESYTSSELLLSA